MSHSLPHRLRVERVEKVAEGVVAIDLGATGEEALPDWAPGAHVDLELGEGLLRQYSLMGRPADRRRYRVAILLEPASRGGSARAHRLREGDVVAAGGPRNHFAFEAAASYIFVAGGIGITPLLPMIAEAVARGADWTLLYGGRSRASMAFVDELRAAHGDRVRVYPQDEAGLIPLAEGFARRNPGALVYCCGPEPLLQAVEALAAHWPDPAALRLERFSPKAAAPGQVDAPFEVHCARSGVTVHVAADQSILDALDSAGIAVLESCREGTCGTCETAVLEGRPDHRDSVLTASEQAQGKTMMVCVSRALSDRLVLDL